MKTAFTTQRGGRFLGLLLLIFVLICCSKTEPDNPETPVTPAEPDKLELAASVDRNPVVAEDGGTLEISFTASTSWSASIINDRADAWCSVGPASGSAGSGKVVVTVKENSEPDDRSATVVIKAGAASQTINVTQKQKDAIILTSTKFELPEEGEEFSVEIKSNVSYKYTISEDAQDWVTYVNTKALKTSVMTFSVEKNESIEGRRGSIIIGEGDLCDTVKVYQAGETPAIVLSSKEQITDHNGGTFSVDVSSNVNVTTLIEYTNEDGTVKTDSENWLRESNTKIMSTNTYHFNVDQNELFKDRYARVIFTNKEKNLSDTVSVYQKSDTPTIILSQKDYVLNSEGGDISVDVISNMNLTTNVEYIDANGNILSNSTQWIKEISTKALKTNTYGYNIAKNESIEDRHARVVFTNMENSLYTDTLNILQHKEGYINVSPANIEIDDKGGEICVEVESNIDYKIEIQSPEWIGVVDKEYAESGKCYFFVNPSQLDSIRTGYVIFLSDEYNASDTLVIHQKQYKTIEFPTKDILISHEQTIFDISGEVSPNKANLQSKIVQEGKWLRATNKPSTKSRGGVTLYFEAQSNDADSTRSALIILYDANEPVFSDTIKVYQLHKDAKHSKNFNVKQKEFIVPLTGCQIALPIEHEGDYYIEDADFRSIVRIKDIMYEGETDYVFFHVWETEQERESQIVIWNNTHSISDTVIVKQQQTSELLHGPMGQVPQTSTVTVHYSGGKYGFKIFTNQSDYQIVQIPSEYNYKVIYCGREKTDYGFLEIFEVPQNKMGTPQDITLAFIGENVTFIYTIRIANKLTIKFENSEEILLNHSGGKFSTNVWTNDNNLNIRIEGENTGWLRTIDSEKESRDDFTRIITTFEASPNATGKQREAYVVAYNGFGETESVRVVQPSGGSILLSESLQYVGSWGQVLKVELVDCAYNVELESGDGWVKVGQSEKNGNRIFQNIEIAENTTDTERQAKVRFTSDTIVNEMSLIQLPQSDALVDNSSEVWKNFKLPKINFKAPYPGSLGTMIYNAIVKDPEVLIAVESRKVLEQLYFSPDEPLIPRRDEIEYKLDNYDGVSAFYSSGNSSGIVLSNQYVENYYKQNGVKKLVEENRGVLSHELTHSFQLSPKGVGDYSNPIFHACIEGMADAVRVLTGHFIDADRPKGGTYLDSYRYTGFFIAWLVKNKDKDFLRKFNMSTQYLDVWSFDGAIKYALGEQYNVDALWNEYQKAMGDI